MCSSVDTARTASDTRMTVGFQPSSSEPASSWAILGDARSPRPFRGRSSSFSRGSALVVTAYHSHPHESGGAAGERQPHTLHATASAPSAVDIRGWPARAGTPKEAGGAPLGCTLSSLPIASSLPCARSRPRRAPAAPLPPQCTAANHSCCNKNGTNARCHVWLPGAPPPCPSPRAERRTRSSWRAGAA